MSECPAVCDGCGLPRTHFTHCGTLAWFRCGRTAQMHDSGEWFWHRETEHCLQEQRTADRAKLAALTAENARLREGMPGPDQLIVLAGCIERDDMSSFDRDECCEDLRRWAAALAAAKAEADPATPHSALRTPRLVVDLSTEGISDVRVEGLAAGMARVTWRCDAPGLCRVYQDGRLVAVTQERSLTLPNPPPPEKPGEWNPALFEVFRELDRHERNAPDTGTGAA